MSIESQSIFFFLLLCVGFLVPIGGFYYLVEYRRRCQRLPLLASFENLSERFEAKKREYEELRAQLADLGQKLVKRDMAAAEAEELIRKKRLAEEDLQRLEPSLRELARVQNDLQRVRGFVQEKSDELAEKHALLNQTETDLTRLKQEEIAKSAELARLQHEIALANQQRSQLQTQL